MLTLYLQIKKRFPKKIKIYYSELEDNQIHSAVCVTLPSLCTESYTEHLLLTFVGIN